MHTAFCICCKRLISRYHVNRYVYVYIYELNIQYDMHVHSMDIFSVQVLIS